MPSMPVPGSRAKIEQVMGHTSGGRSRGSQPWVECVAEAVAYQVQAQDGQEDGEAREEGEPRRLANELAAEAQHRTPGGCWRLGAEAEEAQRGLGQDGVRQRQRDLHDDRTDCPR